MKALKLPCDGLLVDATFGRGGHSRLGLEQLGPNGRILAIDRDPDAVSYGQREFAAEPRIKIVRGRFSELASIIAEHYPDARVDGILLDLGVSSPQLDSAARGFSFNTSGPLDMRMDPDSGVSAGQWLADAEEYEIVRVLRQLGEERFARRIAVAIKQAISEDQLDTTADLSRIVSAAIPVHERHKHPATRTFQAIRMKVNDELGELEKALDQSLSHLGCGGRLVIISFHSLEDRMVKRFFRKQARGDDFPPDLPITSDHLNPRLKLIGKSVRADAAEIANNPRARSAVMRVAEKIA